MPHIPFDIRLELVDIIEQLEPGHPQVITILVNIIKTTENENTRSSAVSKLQEIITTKEQRQGIVTALKPLLNHETYENNFDLVKNCRELLSNIAEDLPYPNFYRAWHGLTENQISPLVQTLNLSQLPELLQTQLTQSNLHQTLQILCIDIETLTDETDTSEIAQILCNKIYRAAFNNSEIPPEVSNSGQLERAIMVLKQRLSKPNLALILCQCNPTPELVKFGRKLTDVVHMAWITSEPIQPPFRGFLPNQPNLESAIQSWLEEIS